MVITENKLRLLYKNSPFKEYELAEKDIVTPSAKQFLIDNNIKIISEGQKEIVQDVEKKESDQVEFKYIGEKGEYYLKKPEYMTQLRDNILVEKDDYRIIFRGKLDTFKSKWIVVGKEMEKLKNKKLNEDFESVFNFLNKLSYSEITLEPLGDVKVFDKTLEEIKHITHNPQIFFNRRHMFGISLKNEELVLKLNNLRTLSRELEIQGVQAFKENDKGQRREDILLALNRLSSCIYIMMLRADSKFYK